MFGKLIGALLLAIALGTNAANAECRARDFLALKLPRPTDHPERVALELAYPDLQFSPDSRALRLDGSGDSDWLDMGAHRNVSASELLRDPTVLEQFTYTYPLDFDLEARRQPDFDPGRIRNDAFFRMLYFDSEAAARRSLVTVSSPSLASVRYRVTRKHNVHCQLQAALNALSRSHEAYSRYFRAAGGSFNWRNIAGTGRLSSHSFGIAVDLNAHLGHYWKWDGAQAGRVGAYRNEIPAGLVATMERFGFIWGGKWHHYDGMHFEYRPELILYARLVR